MGRLPPLLLALLAQGGGLLLAIALADWMPSLPAARLLLQGLFAALAGRLLGLPYWWVPLNLLLPLAVALALSLALPPWLYLLGFVALLLLQWNSGAERVPLYLSNRTTWQALDELLREQGGKQFIDLGCGLGGALLYLARRHPDKHFTGIESAPLPFALAWLRRRLAGLENVTIRYGSFWGLELGRYDRIYAFLSPEPMPRLLEKAQRELAPEGLLISNSFWPPAYRPDRQLTLGDRRRTRLYCWRPGRD
ncbi:MAG: class I SAM-dependent methyltransferase [Pseudomonadota bacterium]